MTGDWRDYRISIWLVMIGVAVALLVNPPTLSIPLFGGAIGAAAGVARRRRRQRDR
jgi:MYXO-CTERM domain-containing protein